MVKKIVGKKKGKKIISVKNNKSVKVKDKRVNKTVNLKKKININNENNRVKIVKNARPTARTTPFSFPRIKLTLDILACGFGFIRYSLLSKSKISRGYQRNQGVCPIAAIGGIIRIGSGSPGRYGDLYLANISRCSGGSTISV